MMQITEDTPPDMLAGAMDLTVHLPTGRTVKMSVERSTPMMDLLVQITTAHHLQHSGHILQALEMAPTSGHMDRVLPYKPNTPIGALDTQHVKVIPKNRSVPVSKNLSAGHQPFESTFRLQVHLPRNQLYVIRVSQNVYLGDIMKKVCQEKNLDSMKYEFRHPGNLDEVLDPKLTLSDYQITEVYIVSKGTVGLTQAFSSSDIMALRKEEERKQLQARTGGGVFSLIFKRGKTSMGSGSLSSENRSISPSHSDDSRSVTPPAIQQQILPPQQAQPPVEKPKPPQRKRRPAPKPPQQQQQSQEQNGRKDSTDKPPSQISGISDSNTSDIQQKKIDNGLTICHSRNSSDSSGYHEPSVLSDNCNTSLPRRPKSAVINEVVNEEGQTGGENSRSSIGNLSKMSTFSKSTTSITSRKKKAAPPPPPPPVLKTENAIITNPDKASPVVASPPVKSEVTDQNPPKSLTTVTESIPENETVSGSMGSSQQKSATTPPLKESPRASLNSSSSPSRQDSTDSTIPGGKTTPRKESLQDSDNNRRSSDTPRRESKSSIAPIESVGSSKRSSFVSCNSMESTNTTDKSSKRNSVLISHESNETKSQVEEFPGNDEPALTTNGHKDDVEELTDLEWQYQLPSPPTAFRDSSPTHLTDVTNYDTITLQDFKEESVVTSPELFEKLRVVKESQCGDTDTISDLNSVVSDDEKQMLSKLTLENLEKRKSLVYNRELSTSLKIAQDNISSSSSLNNVSNSNNIKNNVNNNSNRSIDEASSKRSSMLSELEEVINNGGSKTLARHNSCVTEKTVKPTVDSNLPNFKISTYDNPKRKINIFEDDSIRSTDNSNKMSSFIELPTTLKGSDSAEQSFFTKKNSYIGRSMENISFKKQNGEVQSDEDVFKKPQEFAKYKSSARSNFFVRHQPEVQVTRSESFSMNYNMPVWKPQNPVQRSKSQVALNKYKEEQEEGDECLSKCNSLFDVSGLQSLEVMRLIQTKLNTPSNSTEQLEQEEIKEASRKSSITFEEQTVSVTTSKSEPESTTNTKTYRYQGPPAINLSTWSERPKTKVSLKQDTDYKINTNDDAIVKVSTSISSNSVIKTYVNGRNLGDSNNVSIKINGTEPITTQESGNVVIKIGEVNQTKSIDNFSTRFINHSSAVGYRKPLANVNKIDNVTRPHSVAFESDFDISRVPIVRAVELKKPFKEPSQINNNNTSITQINTVNNEHMNKYADIYKSTEAVNEINGLKAQNKNTSVYLSTDSVNRPVVRVNSFAQNRPLPVVMGFRGAELVNDNTARSRKSWNVPSSYSTLPLKPNPEPPVRTSTFVPNSNVPFSHITLKRVDSNKTGLNDNNNANNVNKLFGNVVLRSRSSQIRNNPNSRYSTGSQFGVIHDYESNNKFSNGIDTHGAPPPPPVMPKVTSVTKKMVKSPESSNDSRDELLSSIRSFGGIKGLRHVKA